MTFKLLFLTSFIFFYSLNLRSRDSLYSKDGNITIEKIVEIYKESVKYKKYSNLEGPSYSVDKADVLRIKYRNGEEEQLCKVEDKPKSETKTSKNSSAPDFVVSKGKKVFIECQDDEIAGLKNEVKNELSTWIFWQIVHDKEEADFVMEVSTHKKAMGVLNNTKVTSKATIRLPDGTNLWESKEFTGTASLYNGYNALHASIKKLVNDGLKKKYN